MTCIISAEERKEDEMKFEKKAGRVKMNLRRNPSEYDKGRRGWSVEFQFG
jgi:hypothetical protein